MHLLYLFLKNVKTWTNFPEENRTQKLTQTNNKLLWLKEVTFSISLTFWVVYKRQMPIIVALRHYYRNSGEMI